MTQLAGLIEMINGELTKLDRKKLITLCTIDVHARDVVQRLIDERVESATAFQWQSQLRYIVSEKTKASQVPKGVDSNLETWVLCFDMFLISHEDLPVLIACPACLSLWLPAGRRPPFLN